MHRFALFLYLMGKCVLELHLHLSECIALIKYYAFTFHEWIVKEMSRGKLIKYDEWE